MAERDDAWMTRGKLHENVICETQDMRHINMLLILSNITELSLDSNAQLSLRHAGAGDLTDNYLSVAIFGMRLS